MAHRGMSHPPRGRGNRYPRRYTGNNIRVPLVPMDRVNCNKTIILDESDQESIIEITPAMQARDAREKYARAVRGRSQVSTSGEIGGQKRKSTPKPLVISDAESPVIIKAQLRNKADPTPKVPPNKRPRPDPEIESPVIIKAQLGNKADPTPKRPRPDPEIEEEFISLGPRLKTVVTNKPSSRTTKRKASPSNASPSMAGPTPLMTIDDDVNNRSNRLPSVEFVDLISNDESVRGQEAIPQMERRPPLKAKRTKRTPKKTAIKAITPTIKKTAANAMKSPQTKKSPKVKKSPNVKKAPQAKKSPAAKKVTKAKPVATVSTPPADEDDDCVVVWDSADVLCVYHKIDANVAKNLVTLFDNDNTIPFIARYRRGLTNNMEAEQLRVVRDAYDELKTVKEKAKAAVTKVKQLGKLSRSVRKNILAAKSVSELDDVMAQFKSQAKGTLAQRARNLGLEEPALKILNGNGLVDLLSLIKQDAEGLSSKEEIELGVQHIIAEIVSKHEVIMDFIRNSHLHEIFLKSAKMRATSKRLPVDAKKHEMNALKFKEFFGYSIPVSHIRPHTAMALNRGENLKVLSIKIVPHMSLKQAFLWLCNSEFLSSGTAYSLRSCICRDAFDDAWDRLIVPAISRHTRSELTKMGEKESLGVFASNLKQILLMPPLKGATILAIDPGFLHGCKIAVVSPSGEVKHTDVIYPKFTGNKWRGPACDKLCELVKKFTVKVIALGDGTASAETSVWLGTLIEKGMFQPIEVSYTVVSERGASIYSCSPVAKEEFPTLDPNVISAVSIARRLQEPLAELVKVEPKHLGVGMYQHDLSDTKLKSALDEVVQECVSFVGVDVNTASVYLLQRVAGLNETKAKNLLQWRNENGPFTSRQQLLEVKGIGPKAFEQCAGFVRVIPSSRAGSWPADNKTASKPKVKVENGSMPNLLDSTNVHPEAYTSAMDLIKMSGVELENLGKPEFIQKLSSFVQTEGAGNVAKKINVEDEDAVMQLTEALTQGPAYDIRVKSAGPVFRSGCTRIEDVKPGDTFTGCVSNVTTFGAFVDIGVGQCGLLHTSVWKGATFLAGQRVEVKVLNVEVARKRIALALK